jgi:NTP pyrophosphatase (non-canonical NTP hydrolase)
MITFNEYQIVASKTASYPSVGNNLSYPVLGLAGETGEVADKIKKIYRDQAGIVTPENVSAIKKELGDVLWYMSALCGELGIELEEVALLNIEKITKRVSTGTIGGSGDDREQSPAGYIYCACSGGHSLKESCSCKS